MILVCGGLADSVTELVCARLQDRGFPYRLLDLASYPAGYSVAWRWTGAGPAGTIAGPGWVLDIDAITGVYVRFLGPEGRFPPEGDPEAAEALQFEADAGLMALLEDLPCPVVNRIGGGMSNNSKPYQALLLRRAGFEVPATLVTSDPAAARAFQAEHGDVIYNPPAVSARSSAVSAPPSSPGCRSCATARRSSRPSFRATTFVCTRSATWSSPPGSRPMRWTTATPISTGSAWS